MICNRLLSFRDAKFLSSWGRLQNPAWAVISCHQCTCNCWPFSSCVMESDGRLLEGRVNITLASSGKNIRWMVSTIRMLRFLVTSSFLLVSSDSANIGKETKQCLHLFHAEAMQKDQCGVTMSSILLKNTQKFGKRSCTAFSTQVTHSPHLSWLRKTEDQRKYISLRCTPDIACEKKKNPQIPKERWFLLGKIKEELNTNRKRNEIFFIALMNSSNTVLVFHFYSTGKQYS